MSALRESIVAPVESLHANRKGAVLVEFLIAFMPLMIVFSSFVQVSQVATASLVAHHATVVAARAAAVISNEHKNTPDAKAGDNKGEIVNAFTTALGPWAHTMSPVDIEIKDESSEEDNFGWVEVTATTEYTCSVPFGSRLVCGGGSGKVSFTRVAKFPHQGACYKDLEGGGCE